jgi:hypothetical protein
MPPLIRQTDNADQLPPYGSTREASPYPQPRTIVLDWRALAVLCVFVAVIGGLLLLAYGRDVRMWIAYGSGRLVIGGALLLAGAFAVRRLLMIEQPGGYKVFIWQATSIRPGDFMHVQNTHAGTPGRLLAQQTVTQAPAPKVIEGQVIDAQPVLSPPLLQALAPNEWLPWFDTRPHGLLAAETGGGKSTTAKAILKSRIDRGEMVFILDPHSSDWFGLPSIGGGEDWEAVWVGMQVVLAEYERRLTERDEYHNRTGRELPHDHFPRITILLDEGNLTHLAMNKTKNRAERSRWDQFTPTIGSGARKVSMSGLVLVQSALVEDIGLSGSMRQNYTRLALDAATTRLMVQREETDLQRKKELLSALAGLEYPATSVQNGRVVLLDRTGLNTVGAPANASAALWADGYEQAERRLRTLQARQAEPYRPPVAKVREDSAVRASVPIAGAIVYPPTITSTKGRIAWLLQQGYKYRQIEKELGVSHQTISQINVALQAQKKTANRGAGG